MVLRAVRMPAGNLVEHESPVIIGQDGRGLLLSCSGDAGCPYALVAVEMRLSTQNSVTLR